MGNNQSFNNFGSKITNTFTLPVVNKTLKKNNLQPINIQQYSQLKRKGYKTSDILQFKAVNNPLETNKFASITNQQFEELKHKGFKLPKILEFSRIKSTYSKVTVDQYIQYNKELKTLNNIFKYLLFNKYLKYDEKLSPTEYKEYILPKGLISDDYLYLRSIGFSLDDIYKFTPKEIKDVVSLKKKYNVHDISNFTPDEIKDFASLKKIYDDLTLDTYKDFLKVKTKKKWYTFDLYQRNYLGKNVASYYLGKNVDSYLQSLKPIQSMTYQENENVNKKVTQMILQLKRNKPQGYSQNLDKLKTLRKELQTLNVKRLAQINRRKTGGQKFQDLD